MNGQRFLAGLRRALPWCAGGLFVLAAVLVVNTVQRIGVDAVLSAVGAIEPGDVMVAAALTAASYLTLTLTDTLAVRTVSDKRLSYPKVASTSFTAVSLGHVLGLAAVSGSTVRYRMYSHFGLGEADVVRIMIFSGTTVAAGLAGVAGSVCLVRPATVAGFAGGPVWLAVTLGGAAILALLGYVAWAVRAEGSIRFGGRRHPVPTPAATFAQAVLGSTNLLLVAGVLYRLLGDAVDVPFPIFASFYAVASALAVLSHVPGGLGVLEAVVLAAVPGAEAAGALVAHRLVYFLLPFLLGSACYLAFELRSRRAAAGDPSQG